MPAGRENIQAGLAGRRWSKQIEKAKVCRTDAEQMELDDGNANFDYGPGIRADLVDHEDLYVGKNVTVGSTDTVAILAPGSFHTAIVDGAIVGDLSGLFLGNSAERAVIKSCM